MLLKRSLALGLIVSIGLGLLPAIGSQAAPLPQLGDNLAKNPGFEQVFGRVDSRTEVGIDWAAWWIPTPAGQPDYLYMQPTYEPSNNCSTTCDHRIHSGGNAQRMFQFFGAYQAGLYQQVSVPENADLRFTMWAQGWSSISDNPQNVSVSGTDMRLRIGIDPLGGTNPLDPRVQWSAPVNALDSWYQFTVYARAQGSVVTIFAYASPFDTRRKNEVYWDDAELVALSGDLAATAQAIYPTPTPIPASQLWTPTPVSVPIGQNLLIDGGFEGKLYIPCSKSEGFPWRQISCEGLDLEIRLPNGRRENIMWNTVQVPIGWKGWWLTPNNNHADPDYYRYHPANCYEDAPEGCKAWHNPEYRDTKGVVLGPARIRSGPNSQKYFTFWSVHEAGVMQTVNVPPGSTVRFSVYMHAWSSNRDMSDLDPSTFKSREQVSMHMKVGIDPTGGDDPWSPNVAWSPEHDSYDEFGYYEVRTVAQSDKITVYTHSMPEKAMKHNDVYVDDAELVVIDGGTAFSPAPVQPDSPPAAAAPNLPAAIRPTALPRPDGSLVHIVQPGDTVFGLALQYDVPMNSIFQLNGLTKESYLQIGQELVIAGGASSAAVPTSAPTPAAAELSATPTPVAIAAMNDPAASNPALLCVRAFEDTNSDGMYDERNALMQGATFSVINDQGQAVVSYTSDGISEPHCFTRLKPGNYTVSIEPATDTAATSDRKWSVALSPGTTVDVNFGSRFQSVAAKPPTNTADSGNAGATLGLAFVVIIASAGLMMYARRRTGVSRA